MLNELDADNQGQDWTFIRGLKQTETFKYLGSVMNAKGGCEQNVKNRIKAAWQKWQDIHVAGVLCDAKMPKYLKGKI